MQGKSATLVTAGSTDTQPESLAAGAALVLCFSMSKAEFAAALQLPEDAASVIEP